MSLEILLAWISVALGVIGLAYGIYQNKMKVQVERSARQQAWEIYAASNHAMGYLNSAKDGKDPNKKEQDLLRAYTLSETLYTQTICNIFRHYQKVSPSLIDEWISDGKIEESAKRVFLKHNGD